MRRLWVPLCLAGVGMLLDPGSLRAGHAGLECSGCHIGHSKAPAGEPGGANEAWTSRYAEDGLPVFELYTSQTFDRLRTDISQPDGASKLCLGCHDGSYPSLGADPNGRLSFASGDLGRSHPISFTYDSLLAARVPNGGLRDPAFTASGLGGTIAQDLLDERGRMQCTSCHDVHGTGGYPRFLRYPYDPARGTDKVMCLVCHNK